MHFQLRKVWPPLRSVDLIAKPLVLATYRMAPSLPFKFFETFAEIIEDILERPVVLLHETKDNRPIPSDLVEIAIMPASENWNIGKLLPVTFEFQHALNMPKCTNMYADVVVLKHSSPRISLGRSMSSLQECKVSIAKKNYRHNSVAGLFWNYLISTGRTPQFFATVLDANNGRDVISMVIDGIADAGIVEAPVLTCNRYNLVGAEELEIFASIGPLPPYRIMIHPRAAEEYGNMLTDGLLENDSKWHKRLNCLGILGFAKNSADNYKPIDETPVVTEIFYSSEY
ncbi:uncharacterized protein LOC105434152 [Pogonomyrmex barbatus]|uniref:Uncharacterized protein LOC105434152 n=1 Tax=Pogonomyrmex barbatus TaxID=144034 RepID=A0A8N1SAM7_9HYME|nr:uncharacterized protein LOC105434152 [Pogonomyrmex barbatus]